MKYLETSLSLSLFLFANIRELFFIRDKSDPRHFQVNSHSSKWRKLFFVNAAFMQPMRNVYFSCIWARVFPPPAPVRERQFDKTKQINFIKTSTRQPVQRAGNDSIEIPRIFRFNVSLLLEILNAQIFVNAILLV